jgi:hypothetical protein
LKWRLSAFIALSWLKSLIGVRSESVREHQRGRLPSGSKTKVECPFSFYKTMDLYGVSTGFGYKSIISYFTSFSFGDRSLTNWGVVQDGLDSFLSEGILIL